MEQKAALDLEVMTKLLMAVYFAAENESGLSHFHYYYTRKTESVEIRTDQHD